MERKLESIYDLQIFKSSFECICGSEDIDIYINAEEDYMTFVCNKCGVQEIIEF